MNLEITQIGFYILLFIVLFVYWRVPTTFQWKFLLLVSVVFYLFNAPAYTLVYLAGTLVVTYKASLLFCKATSQQVKKRALFFALFFNLSALAFFKYVPWKTLLGKDISTPVAPLAISFYTLQMISYLLDSYWGVILPEKNFFKLALFNVWFPQMVSGPISKYGDVAPQFYEEHRFDYTRVVNALKRIAWGMVKKTLISAKLGLVVDAVYRKTGEVTGFWVGFTIVLFVIQLYADFSGCMDIVLGVSQCFGIKLNENFKAPLLSSSVQEFWQRWHMTLGGWLRDYVMYPILKSAWMRRLTGILKKQFGKKTSKTISISLAMFLVWTCMGVWHGNGIKYIVGEGWWFCALMILENLVEPIRKKYCGYQSKGTKAFLKILGVIITFSLVSIGNVFFRADSLRQAILMLKSGFLHPIGVRTFLDILIDGGVTYASMGEILGMVILVFNCILMLAVEILKYNDIDPLAFLNRRKKTLRWLVYWNLCFSAAMSMFDTVKVFIYEGF